MAKETRMVVLAGRLNEDIVNKASAAMISASTESQKPIMLCINSSGGFVDLAFKLCETIMYLGAPVITVGYGSVASAANIIFAAGEKRILLSNATLFHHRTGCTLPEVDPQYIFSKQDLLAYIDQIIGAVRKIESSYHDILKMVTQEAKISAEKLDKLITAAPNGQLSITAPEALKLGLVDKVFPSFADVSDYIKKISTHK